MAPGHVKKRLDSHTCLQHFGALSLEGFEAFPPHPVDSLAVFSY